MAAGTTSLAEEVMAAARTSLVEEEEVMAATRTSLAEEEVLAAAMTSLAEEEVMAAAMTSLEEGMAVLISLAEVAWEVTNPLAVAKVAKADWSRRSNKKACKLLKASPRIRVGDEQSYEAL
jgi:hypothetical protein